MDNNLVILAIDTSQKACSVTLCRGKEQISARSEMLGRGHAERLLPMIDEVMADNALSYNAIDRIAVITGPGAYTGVRIGVAAARGLALVGKIPCLGFTALEVALANEDVPDGIILSTVAGRDETVFAQLFTKKMGRFTTLNGAHSISLDEVRPWRADYIIGSGRVQLGLDGEIGIEHMPNCYHLAMMAGVADPEQNPAEPTYFRSADALPAKVIFEMMD